MYKKLMYKIPNQSFADTSEEVRRNRKQWSDNIKAVCTELNQSINNSLKEFVKEHNKKDTTNSPINFDRMNSL